MSLTRSGSLSLTPGATTRLSNTLSVVANGSVRASGGIPCARAELTASISKILGLRQNAFISVGPTTASGSFGLVADPATFTLKLCGAICFAPDPCTTLVSTSFGGFSTRLFFF